MNTPGSFARINAMMLLAGGALLAGITALSGAMAHDLGEVLTRNTIRLALAWYAAALILMLQLDVHGWAAASPVGRI